MLSVDPDPSDLALPILASGHTKPLVASYKELCEVSPYPVGANPARDYQIEALEAFLTWRTLPDVDLDSKEALVSLFMGLGKTTTASECVRAEVAAGGKVLWVAHRTELKDQAERDILRQTGIQPVQKIKKGTKNADVMICSNSIQSKAISRLGSLIEPTLIVIDEAHHAFAATYMRLKAQWPNAKILNLTGTPYRLDVANQMSLGRPLKTMSSDDGLARGLLAPLTVVARIEHDLTLVKTRAGDYEERALTTLMSRPEMVEAAGVAIAKDAPGKRGLVYCSGINHASLVERDLTARGLRVRTVIGSTPQDERDKIYEMLRKGEIDQIVSVGVLTEGFDLPEVDMVTILRPTKSACLFAQMIARGMRICPTTGKTDCKLIVAIDTAKRKGAKYDLILPYPSEVTYEQGRRGATISAAALYLSWFKHKTILPGAPGHQILTPADLYKVLYGTTPDAMNRIPRLTTAFDASKLPKNDIDGFELLCRALGYNSVEHLHMRLKDLGYVYHPHAGEPEKVAPSTPSGKGSNKPLARIGKAHFVHPTLKNLVLNLQDPKVTAIERKEMCLDMHYLPNYSGTPTKTFWKRYMGGDFSYIIQKNRKTWAPEVVYVMTAAGNFLAFDLTAPTTGVATDPAGMPVLRHGATMPLLGKISEGKPTDLPAYAASDRNFYEPASEPQKDLVGKLHGLTNQQIAGMSITKGLAESLIDQKMHKTADLLANIAARIPTADYRLAAKTSLVGI